MTDSEIISLAHAAGMPDMRVERRENIISLVTGSGDDIRAVDLIEADVRSSASPKNSWFAPALATLAAALPNKD